ncbi:MAG: flagellar protein FlaG [Pseudomonadota bacterium]|nr:flagellar protein FlaG [Pseudomonadota bacterium]
MSSEISVASSTQQPMNAPSPPQSSPAPRLTEGSTSKQAFEPAAPSSVADRAEAVDALSEVTAEIEAAMTVLNETLSIGPTSASISKDNELNKFVVTIFDDESGEIIREIPNEAMQRFARNLKEIQGLIFDERG